MTPNDQDEKTPIPADDLVDDAVRVAQQQLNAQIAPEAGALLTNAAKGAVKMARRDLTRQHPGQKAGFKAEEWHETTFNADAIRKGRSVRAHAPRDNGPVDVRLTDSGRTVGEAQIKTYRKASGTTRAISDRKYTGMQKVVPGDQVADVRRVSGARGVDGLGQRDYADTARRAAGEVKYEGVKSRSLTVKEARSPLIGARLVVGEVGKVAGASAKGSAAVGATFSAVSNVGAVISGEKSVGQAVTCVAKDTGKAAVSGAGSALATTAVTAGLTRAGQQALAKGGAAGIIVSAGLDVGKDVAAALRGEMTAGQVAGRSVEHVAGAGGAWGGATAGASTGAAIGTFLIPIPGVGTAVGGLLGGLFGGMAGNTGARKVVRGIQWLFSD